jgi:hypothetical protein
MLTATIVSISQQYLYLMGVTPGGLGVATPAPQNFMKFITFDNVNYGQFVAKRQKLQIFYLSIGLVYFRLEHDGSESSHSADC